MNTDSGFEGIDALSVHGCAAKWPIDRLTSLLNEGPFRQSDDGESAFGADDAAVLSVEGLDLALFSTDMSTPMTDDPYLFGEIAAANALSDIYAMGGRPIAVLNLLCCPVGASFSARQVLAGGAAMVHRAGALVVGGHTMRDSVPKYGLAVIGSGEPDHLLRKAGGQPGDEIWITKALGTGVYAKAVASRVVSEAEVPEAYSTMRELNDVTSAALVECEVRCATDVTGFGLAGHLREVLLASHCAAVLQLERIPMLRRSMEFLQSGIRIADIGANIDTLSDSLLWEAPESRGRWIELLVGPETNGGLLFTCTPDVGKRIRDHAAFSGGSCVRIGRCVPGTPGMITIR